MISENFKNRLNESLKKNRERLKKIEFYFDECQKNINENDKKSYDENMIEALYNSDLMALNLRNLSSVTIDPIWTINHPKEQNQVLKKVENMELSLYDISISVLKSGGFKIKMPIIKPFARYKKVKLFDEFRKKNYAIKCIEDVEYDSKIISLAIKKFLSENKINKINTNKLTIVYVNNYDEKYIKSDFPDTDNYSYKRISDEILKNFSIDIDDSWVDFCYFSRKNISTFTEIFILPNESFFEFFCSEID